MSNLFLFITSNPHEKIAFESKFVKEGEDFIKGKSYKIGKFGLYSAAYIHIDEQGPASPDGMLLVNLLAQKIKPIGIVMTGIAFGADEQTQKIGDVLVSEKILSYDYEKISENNNEYKNDPERAGFQLLHAFRESEDWVYEIDGRQASVYIGAVLTGSKLINNSGFKNKLLKDFERHSPIGGEMEAYGIYSMCRTHGIPEWIIVKAICDWAYDKDANKEEYQKTASKAAVDYCHYVFSKKVFEDLINEIAEQALREIQETDYFKRSMEHYNKMRSSRFRYIEIDENLFAGAKPRQFDVVVKDSDQQAKTLLETLNTCKGNFFLLVKAAREKPHHYYRFGKTGLEKKSCLFLSP